MEFTIQEVSRFKNKIRIIDDSGTSERVFEHDIVEFQIIDNKVIVRIDALDKPKTENRDRNIFCLDEKAQILWQIKKHKTNTSYTGFKMIENGGLRVFNWSSDHYDVDLTTGRLLHARWNLGYANCARIVMSG